MISRLRYAMRSDRGSSPVAFVLTVPLFGLFIAMVIMAGRITSAEITIQSAANEAARAASIERTSSSAQSSAKIAAQSALSTSSIDCTSKTVTASTSATGKAAGQAGTVTVTVNCRVPLSDLGLPVGGSRLITATGTSVVDTYRES